MSTIAETIIEQFGRRSLYMIGARNVCAGHNSVQFDFMRTEKTSARRCRIVYDECLDCYTVEFLRKLRDGYINVCGVRILDRIGGYEPVERLEGLFFDEIRTAFERFTGLATSL